MGQIFGRSRGARAPGENTRALTAAGGALDRSSATSAHIAVVRFKDRLIPHTAQQKCLCYLIRSQDKIIKQHRNVSEVFFLENEPILKESLNGRYISTFKMLNFYKSRQVTVSS